LPSKILCFSVTNEFALEKYLGYICVPNLVQIGDKLRPLVLTKEKMYFVTMQVGIRD